MNISFILYSYSVSESSQTLEAIGDSKVIITAVDEMLDLHSLLLLEFLNSEDYCRHFQKHRENRASVYTVHCRYYSNWH